MEASAMAVLVQPAQVTVEHVLDLHRTIALFVHLGSICLMGVVSVRMEMGPVQALLG